MHLRIVRSLVGRSLGLGVVLMLGSQRVLAIDFMPLGDLLGGVFASSATGVSADGRVVVGFSESAEGEQAFRWTLGGGMEGLGYLPGGNESAARDVAGDGSVIVGRGRNAAGFYESFRWTSGSGMTTIGGLAGAAYGEANCVSLDGRYVVGLSGSEAYRWDENSGMVRLGDIPPNDSAPGDSAFFYSVASGVASDGQIVVGRGSPGPTFEATLWTMDSGMLGLGTLGGFPSQANAVSSDGEVIVGVSGLGGSEFLGGMAFRWTESEGMLPLGLLQEGLGSQANDVSGDGSTIVGYALISESGIERRAFHWTKETGMQDLLLALEVGGINMDGWQLEVANSISDNGRFIVGTGINPNGNQEAWLVDLQYAPVPEGRPLLPAAIVGLVALSANLFGRSRGRGLRKS